MREYACLMLDFEMPEFIKSIQSKIAEEELFFGKTEKEKEKNEYGIEDESHITIVYGLDNEVKFEDLKKYLFDISKYKTILTNISVFENEDFDVLKAEAKCPLAAKSNGLISKNFDVHTEFKDYNAHMTIAYMQKGQAKKYTKKILDKIETLTPYEFNYSYNKDGEDINEFYK
jgi:hypothetical protein